jgi:L-ribulose-5-phosphate 3-epimerase
MKRRHFLKQTSSAAIFASLLPADSLLGNTGIIKAKSPYICIFSKHLQWLDYREMAKLAADIGFTGIDLTIREGGHVNPGKVKRELPLAVQHIRDAGLEVPMITTGITDPHDPVTRDILKTAGNLGIPLYRTGWYRYQKGVSISESIEHARMQLNQLQAINEANNIAASYQNHAGLFIGSSGWDLMQIIQGLDPAWTGVQFDIRHAMVEGPDTWPVILELLAPYINSVDIKDFTWEAGGNARVVNVPLGKGLVRFDAFLQQLMELQIRTDFSIHYEYALGGAEHGDRELGISKEAFVELVGEDLRYFKTKLQK